MKFIFDNIMASTPPLDPTKPFTKREIEVGYALPWDWKSHALLERFLGGNGGWTWHDNSRALLPTAIIAGGPGYFTLNPDIEVKAGTGLHFRFCIHTVSTIAPGDVDITLIFCDQIILNTTLEGFGNTNSRIFLSGTSHIEEVTGNTAQVRTTMDPIHGWVGSYAYGYPTDWSLNEDMVTLAPGGAARYRLIITPTVDGIFAVPVSVVGVAGGRVYE